MLKYRLAPLAACIASTAAVAADNPMWKTDLKWTCRFTSVVVCERSLDCVAERKEGLIKLDYPENLVTDEAGSSHSIKRHYVQTVAGSPISDEVKVELSNNDVLWLTPVDGAATFSNNWIGAIVSPKAGVVVQELRPLACSPGL